MKKATWLVALMGVCLVALAATGNWIYNGGTFVLSPGAVTATVPFVAPAGYCTTGFGDSAYRFSDTQGGLAEIGGNLNICINHQPAAVFSGGEMSLLQNGGGSGVNFYITGANALSLGTATMVLGAVKASVYTVSTLPAASSLTAGSQVVVSDANSFTPGSCTGGGSDYMIAVTNGTSWSCH